MYGQSQGKRPRVLLVDDDADTVEATALLFEQFGASVDKAYTGKAGIERARAASPDLIIVDLAMPDVDGYEVARALQNPPLPADPILVAMSGWGRPEDKVRCAGAGFDLHLLKPVDPDILQQLLETRGDASALVAKLPQPSSDHVAARRGLLLAWADMAGTFIQLMYATASHETAIRHLDKGRKAHDAIARMLSVRATWPDEDRLRFEQLLAVLRRTLRL